MPVDPRLQLQSEQLAREHATMHRPEFVPVLVINNATFHGPGFETYPEAEAHVLSANARGIPGFVVCTSTNVSWPWSQSFGG